MSVRDKHIESSAVVAHRDVDVALITAVTQTNKVALRFTPGFAFEVVSVSTFCSAKAGAVAADVLIGATVVATAAVFTADTEVPAALVAAKASRRGSKTAQLIVRYTSDGTGALTNGSIVVRIRPRGLARETN